MTALRLFSLCWGRSSCTGRFSSAANNFKSECAVLDPLRGKQSGAYAKLRHRETGAGLDISSVLSTGLDHIRCRVWGGRRAQLAKRMGPSAKLGWNGGGEPIAMAGCIPPT